MTEPKKTKHHDPKTDDLAQKVAEAAKADQQKTEDQEGDSRLPIRRAQGRRGNEKEGAGMKEEGAEKQKSTKQEIPACPFDELRAGAGMKNEVEIKKIEELTNHLARCMADLQNYRRRSEEDKGRFVKFANAEMLKVLLPAIENLDRSCKHLPENLKEDAWAKGVLHTQADIQKALAIIGVKRIETVGKKMDLNFHEVLMQGPGEKEMVTEELDPGYTLNGETIKAAKVKVGDGSK